MKDKLFNYTIFCLMGILSIFGCTKEEKVETPEFTTKLISEIEHIYIDVDNVNSHIQTFIYDEEDILQRINDDRDWKYDIVPHYNDAGLVDSISYENKDQNLSYGRYLLVEYEDDRVTKTTDISFGTSVGIISYTTELKFNSDDQPDEFIRTSGNSDYKNVDKITWTDGNPTRIKNYNKDGELISESELKFDNKANYRKGNILSFGSIEYYQTNNQINSFLTDYSGLIDPVCFDCDVTYEYSSAEYPTRQEYEWNLVRHISYR